MNSHFTRIAAACLAGGAALLVASAASAQVGTPHNDWRRINRSSNGSDRYASPQSFAFEARFGAYFPGVDEEFSAGGAGPYERSFGGDNLFYFGLELDWLPLRIPYVGAIGPGLGWGYTSASGKGFEDGTEDRSEEDTSLTIMPMHLSAVIRFDELMRRTGVPVVPYAKGGLGMGLWYAGKASGGDEQDGVAGEGITWGTHFAFGAMLALNWLDRRSASQLDESTGINHTYLFGEWMFANLDGLGSRPQMHVGSSTWVLGLALDM
ncbi:MXAN_2562 family outer membrane beta-barrel protein [Sorangium sp. So ce131]|uniref:MXAN_2562 family outer membrane beta-barrel protein n=1 Tax=Sorangium sp. So ce131 TaxID=3133282 RepID=UPI003F5FFA03